MSLHAGQVKTLLRGQIIIAKVTLERAHGFDFNNSPLVPTLVRMRSG